MITEQQPFMSAFELVNCLSLNLLQDELVLYNMVGLIVPFCAIQFVRSFINVLIVGSLVSTGQTTSVLRNL